jgi:hypothetical protein
MRQLQCVCAHQHHRDPELVLWCCVALTTWAPWVHSELPLVPDAASWWCTPPTVAAFTKHAGLLWFDFWLPSRTIVSDT